MANRDIRDREAVVGYGDDDEESFDADGGHTWVIDVTQAVPRVEVPGGLTLRVGSR